jgi:hypothetical protein
MKRSLIARVVITTLLFSITPAAQAAPMNGTKCTKVGSVTLKNGQSYTCTKSKGKLVYKPSEPLENILLDSLYTANLIEVFKVRSVNQFSEQNTGVFSQFKSPGVISNLLVGCQAKGVFLYGKVAFTSDLGKANFRVYSNYNSSTSDLAVAFVRSGANSCGLWQIVDIWDNPNFLVALVRDKLKADFSFYTGY